MRHPIYALMLAAAVLAAPSLSRSEQPGAAAAAPAAGGQPKIPCNPEGPPPEAVIFGPGGTIAGGPNVVVIEDQVVTEPLDVNNEFPQLLSGVDSGLGQQGCTTSFDVEPDLPVMTPTGNIPPIPGLPKIKPGNQPSDPIIFVPPPPCEKSEQNPRPPACGRPLDCSLPFCGRDIIFVHGLVFEALFDAVKARHGIASAQHALDKWPQDAASFTTPGGYYRDQAYARWENYAQKKLGLAYLRAQATHAPRILIVAWAAPQRMEIAIHAVLSQITTAMHTGAGVMTLDLSRPDTPIIPALIGGPGFCGRGCAAIHAHGGLALPGRDRLHARIRVPAIGSALP